MYKNSYGILDDPNLIYTQGCFDDLKYCIKEALRLGAKTIIMGDIGELNKKAYKICKQKQKYRQNPFKIIIVSLEKKNSKLLEKYKDDEIILLYSDKNSISHNISLYKINQFIINNTFKNIAFIENSQYFDSLTTNEFTLIDATTSKQTYFQAKTKIEYTEPFDNSNIDILE